MGYCHAVFEVFTVGLVGVSILGVQIDDDVAVQQEMDVAGRWELLVFPVEGQLCIDLNVVAVFLGQVDEVFGVDCRAHSEVEGVVDVHRYA